MFRFLLMFIKGDALAAAFVSMLRARANALGQHKDNQDLLAERESLNTRISSGVVALGEHQNAYRESQKAIRDAYELILD